jgi:hypothetical protein
MQGTAYRPPLIIALAGERIVKTIVLATLLLGICAFSGCKKYRAEALVLVTLPEGTSYGPSFFAVEAKTIRSLASSLLPTNAKLLVEHVTPKTGLIRIAVIQDDSMGSLISCSLVTKAYIKQANDNVEISLQQGIVTIQVPLGNRHAKTSTSSKGC